ncbi:AAA family ATPase [Rhodobacteraceae bacterium NNCM2]|nr:AAA family ATPase [Coraliihabitans acroporae]
MFPGKTPPGTQLGVAEFVEAARLAAMGREDLARRGYAPDGTKRLRRFSSWEVARYLLPTDPSGLRQALKARPDLPQGEANEGGTRMFRLDEIATLQRYFARETGQPASLRPAGQRAKVLAVANFKGGVGKTSTAAHIAMAAALDGLRVLVIDLDSQGSMTSLMGGKVADEWQTAFPLIAGDFAREIAAAHPGHALDETLEAAAAMVPGDVIQTTHWPNIDLIGAQLNLYWAEFQIPVWRMAHKGWPLWEALGRAIETGGLDRDYDLIILDTPPALGYLTINALAAADLMLVPVGASFLEFDSTGRFFEMLATTFASIEEGEATTRTALGLPPIRFEWDAVRCLITRYDASQQKELADVMQAWFGPLMAEHRQEYTALVGQAAEAVSGIYEADPRDFNRETYQRGRATFDATWAEIRDLLALAWAMTPAETTEEEARHGAA